jgi:hypothetical protein
MRLDSSQDRGNGVKMMKPVEPWIPNFTQT